MKRLLTAVLLLTAFVAAVGAASEKPRKPLREEPIFIKSDRLDADTRGNHAVFTGSVSARQGDVTMFADRMTVFYSEGGDVDRVECTGKVRIIQGGRTATAGKAVYDNATGTIVLTEKPAISEGDDTVTGTEIVYSVTDQRSRITGAPGTRVEAVIHPREKGKNAGKP